MPSVHFKFKSQKDAQRVTFDGTAITVWDLKREIISVMKLGDGSDFELALYHDNTDEEYLDDTEQIPQSSLVLARRLPAKIPGKGSASRYVSGKAPVNARSIPINVPPRKSGKIMDMSNAQTEEEKLQAFFNVNEEQWRQKQQEMASETRVAFGTNKNFQKKANVPEGEPPHGYICYRCGKKGHWIQACPTNDDPNFEGRVRIKRTTGIPRSMLKTIDQSELEKLDETQRQNMMVDADGQYVLAKTDEKEWNKHLEKVKASAAAQEKAGLHDKELESRGLECPIDKRLFVDPMKTPCCGKTYCNECITNALIESDLTCPGCETENIILEQLEADEDMKERIKTYETEKAVEKKQQIESQSSSPRSPTKKLFEVNDAGQSPPGSKSPVSTSTNGAIKSKKRSADEASGNKLKVDAAPAMKRQKSGEQPADKSKIGDDKPTPATGGVPNDVPVNQFMPPDMSSMMQNLPNMATMSNMPNMNFAMPAMPFMPMAGMINPGMMPNFMPPNLNNMAGMPGMNGMAFPSQQFGNMFPANFSNPMANNNHTTTPYNQPNQYPNQSNQQTNGINSMAGVPSGPKQQNQYQKYPTGPANPGKFSNQQRHTGKEEDNAYMRQPVNPHRHQNRQKRVRPSDYREL